MRSTRSRLFTDISVCNDVAICLTKDHHIVDITSPAALLFDIPATKEAIEKQLGGRKDIESR